MNPKFIKNKICFNKNILIVSGIILMALLSFAFSQYIIRSNKLLNSKASTKDEGQSTLNSTIIGGESVNPGEYPFVSYFPNGCTGTLIASQWVLTAAHCIHFDYNLRVAIDMVDKKEFYKKNTIAYGAIIHPDYIPQTDKQVAYNDIALVKLSKEITGIPLPIIPSSDGFYSYQHDVIVVGWGCIGITPKPNVNDSSNIAEKNNFIFGNILQKIILPINISNFKYKEGDTSREFMYGYTDTRSLLKSTCFGDSGGPIIYEQANNILLIGVHSKSYAGLDIGPGVASKTSVYSEWINEKIEAGQVTPFPTPVDCRKIDSIEACNMKGLGCAWYGCGKPQHQCFLWGTPNEVACP